MSSLPTVRVRIVFDRHRPIGPGKADLLAAIDRLGSIAAAARSMEMSYQRAWSLVDELNRAFRRPLVASSRGGAERGGAALTKTGRSVLERYRAIERAVSASSKSDLRRIARLAR